MNLEYRTYLEEVVKMLEQDPQFKAILANATDEQIQVNVHADEAGSLLEMRVTNILMYNKSCSDKFLKQNNAN